MQTVIVSLLGLTVILLLIVRTKPGPFMSMLLGGLITGMGYGVGSSETISTLTGGFGNACKSIGLAIMFGTILGTYLERSNPCRRITTSLLEVAGEENVSVASAVAGYPISIPVLLDVTLIILPPIIKAVSKKTRKVLCVFATLTACALLCTNVYAAPTLAPLAMAAVVELDMGTSIVYGLVVAAISTATAGLFCMLFLDKRPAGYFTSTDDAGKKGAAAASMKEPQMPSPIEAILSILTPIILIVVNSICRTVLTKESPVFAFTGFIGDKNIALVINIISVILLLKEKLSGGETFGAIGDVLRTAGPVIFITAAGGILAEAVGVTGAGQMFADALAASFLPVIPIPFLTTALSRFTQSSDSVAALLGAFLSIPLAEAGPMNPIAAFISISAGSRCDSYVNNSFSRVFAEFFGYDTGAALKTLCVTQNVVLAGIGLFCARAISVI